MRRPRAAALFLALLLFGSVLRSEQVAEYQVKAEFIERFTRFVDWPSTAHVEHANSFAIGVVGDNPFNGYLVRMAANRKIKGKSVEVRQVAASDSLSSFDVVFISSSERKNLSSVLSRANGLPVLTIGDTSGFADSGVMINFYNAGDQVRFEINETAADHCGLKVSSKLLALARVVGGDGR